ncbi:hypothetical protein AMJ85_07350 [candidate division BRC1 bacterium SM23_51]|nr:MAG: hypothetical protein AMJ85_07350 [candidate division BRC1 bacterium SM23_51]
MGKPLARTCALLLALSISVLADAAPAPDRGDLVSLTQLRTFAFTNKTEYVLGEPVLVKLVFANWSHEDTFELQGYWHPANDFEILVARSGEIPERYTAGIKDILVPATTYLLPPLSLRTRRWLLCHEPERENGFLLDQPGLYTIACQARVAINRTPRVLKLDEIRVQIKEPTAEQEQVLKLILRPECAKDLQEVRARDETAQIWEDLAQRFPKSLWAPYAKLLLARRALDTATGDFTALAEQFEAIARDYPDFPLRDDVYYACALSWDRMGKPLEALRWLQRIEREFPTSPHMHASSRLFGKYIYREGWERIYSPWYLAE